MATKNLGQVAGLFIGTSAPMNTTLIWFDNTSSVNYHKVYNFSTNSWESLDKNIISLITYAELKSLAQGTGLLQGSWYKITDQGNTLALAITTTKIQYSDLNDNILIDDLASSIIYTVTSSNLLIDDINGVWDVTNKKLKFTFEETIHDGNTDNDYLLGKKQRNNIWSLAKYKISSFISAISGNSLSWNKGLFFDFNSSLKNKVDVSGGIVGKDTYEEDKSILQRDIDNVSEANANILVSAKTYTDSKVTNLEIYNKTLPIVPGTGTPVNILQNDTLKDIITKINKWIISFKTADNISIPSSFSVQSTRQSVNNNDSISSAIAKLAFLTNNTKPSNLYGPLDNDHQKFTSTGGQIDLASLIVNTDDEFYLKTIVFSSPVGSDVKIASGLVDSDIAELNLDSAKKLPSFLCLCLTSEGTLSTTLNININPWGTINNTPYTNLISMGTLASNQERFIFFIKCIDEDLTAYIPISSVIRTKS